MFVTMAGVQSAPRAMRGPRVSRRIGVGGIGEQGIAHTLSGRIFAGALGEDTTLTEAPPTQQTDYMPILSKVDAQTQKITALIEDQNKNRRISLMIAGVSALFAAVKLGIIAFPHIKARVRGEP